MKEQLQKDFDNIIRNLSLSQRDTEIKQFYLDNFIGVSIIKKVFFNILKFNIDL